MRVGRRAWSGKAGRPACQLLGFGEAKSRPEHIPAGMFRAAFFVGDNE